MKKLIPGMLALLIILCGCNANKSFLHQRYTHFKHKKTKTVAEPQSYARSEYKATVNTPELNTPEVVVTSPETKTEQNMVYTNAVVNRVILPVVQKGKEQFTGLVSSNSRQPVTQVSKIKPLNLDQKQETRGLLFGVIDAILAIILMALFIALVIWLVLILL